MTKSSQKEKKRKKILVGPYYQDETVDFLKFYLFISQRTKEIEQDHSSDVRMEQ